MHKRDEQTTVYRQTLKVLGILLTTQPSMGMAVGSSTLSDTLIESLQAQGWHKSQTEDGSVIYRQPTTTAKPDTPSETTPTTISDSLRESLKAQGWRITHGDDGSTFYHYPKERSESGNEPLNQQPLGRCEGVTIDSEWGTLPVDEWGEVDRLAKSWLQQSGKEGLLVGMIRKILRVYLVSLVNDVAPYELKHQLAIRASDGQVLLLE
ncbi:MAG: hypothetical protein HQL49_13495 [Gammaproteobacteria bacterium]|nr:hypothetical protein [Gammaproteobacteria bacterium]